MLLTSIKPIVLLVFQSLDKICSMSVEQTIIDTLQHIADGAGLIAPPVKIILDGTNRSGFRNEAYYISVESDLIGEGRFADDGQNVVAHEVAHLIALHNNAAYRDLGNRFETVHTTFEVGLRAGDFSVSALNDSASLLFVQATYEEMVAGFIGFKLGDTHRPINSLNSNKIDNAWMNMHKQHADLVRTGKSLQQASPRGLGFAMSPRIQSFLNMTHHCGRAIGNELGFQLSNQNIPPRRMLLLRPDALPHLLLELHHFGAKIPDSSVFFMNHILKMDVVEPRLPQPNELV